MAKNFFNKTKVKQDPFIHSLKINNNIKLTTHPIQISNTLTTNNIISTTKPSYAKPISIVKLPQIISKQSKQCKQGKSTKFTTGDLCHKTFLRKQYKKDSNSSLSNNSNNNLISDFSKSCLPSDINYETTSTTEEPKFGSKLVIFFEIEKYTLFIQKMFRGFAVRKRLRQNAKVVISNLGFESKNQFLSHDNRDRDNLLSNRSIVSYVSIKSNEVNFSDEDDELNEQYYDENEEEGNVEL